MFGDEDPDPRRLDSAYSLYCGIELPNEAPKETLELKTCMIGMSTSSAPARGIFPRAPAVELNMRSAVVPMSPLIDMSALSCGDSPRIP